MEQVGPGGSRPLWVPPSREHLGHGAEHTYVLLGDGDGGQGLDLLLVCGRGARVFKLVEELKDKRECQKLQSRVPEEQPPRPGPGCRTRRSAWVWFWAGWALGAAREGLCPPLTQPPTGCSGSQPTHSVGSIRERESERGHQGRFGTRVMGCQRWRPQGRNRGLQYGLGKRRPCPAFPG